MPPVTTESLNTTTSSALEAQIQQMLNDYGLGDLASWATTLLSEGAGSDRIQLELEDQPAFRERFPAIFSRREQGLPPVSVAEILSYERQVSELESFYGVPAGTINAQDAMSNDVSYNEVQATMAAEAQLLASDADTQAAAAVFYGYGATRGELLGAMLNGEVGLPVLQQRIQAAAVAGEANAQGFGELTVEEAEDLTSRGVNEEEAREAFGLLSRSRQLTRTFNREQLLGLVAGDASALQALEGERDAALAVFEQGGSFASGVRGLGSAR